MWRIRVLLLATLGVLIAGLLGLFLSTDKAANAQNAQPSLTSPNGGCIVPPAGMVAWYAMDETSGNVMMDLTGTYNGTYINNPAVNTGHYVLNSRTFDGASQYGEASPGPDFGAGDFTIDAWVNLTSTGPQIILDKRSATPVGYMLFVANGSLGVQLSDGNGQPRTYAMSGSPGINDGQWHFVAVSVQRVGANNVMLMADSVIQSFPNAPTGSLNNTSGLRVARSWTNNLDPVDHYFLGSIDEVELFARTLSEIELGNIRNAGTDGKCKTGPTATPTNTDTPTAVNTNTPTNTATVIPTNTATATQGGAITPTSTRTRTAFPPGAPTKTATPTRTGTPPTQVPTPSNCYSYGITVGTGTIVPALTLVPGSNCDDCEVTLDISDLGFYFPFYDLYEHFGVANGNQGAPSGPPIMRKLRMRANGELELSNDSPATPGPYTDTQTGSTGKPVAPGVNTCLPSPGTSYTIFPHWDDLRTDCQGCGIFTNITGAIGSRILDIEWRGEYYLCGGRVDFELRLHESTGEFEVIYGQVDQSGSQTTVGVQRDAENYTQFACNTLGSITPGMMLTFTRQTCGAATNTPTATVTGTPPTATSTLTPVVACVQPPPPTSTPCPITFTDVQQGSTFYDNIRCLACRGIVNGYPDGTFRPQNNVTRGQLSKIISNSAGFNNPAGAQIFEDVQPGSTFYDFVQRLATRGYIGGYPCGSTGEPCVSPTNRPYFRPNNNASRGQISKIVSNAAGFVDPAGAQQFEDVQPGSTFYDFVQRLASRGFITGYPCGSPGEPCVSPTNRPYFRPNSNATRGQTTKIVSNTFFPGCSTPARSK